MYTFQLKYYYILMWILFDLVSAPPSRLVKDEYGGESVSVEGNMDGRPDFRTAMSAQGKLPHTGMVGLY